MTLNKSQVNLSYLKVFFNNEKVLYFDSGS